MGMGINLFVSRATAQDDWERAYEETLQLVDAFHLCESSEIALWDWDIPCLTRSTERRLTPGPSKERELGWFAIADADSHLYGEEFALLRRLPRREDVATVAGDAMLGCYFRSMHEEREHPWRGNVYRLWGLKTQGKPYHMALVAIACLLESRLGDKVFFDGSITVGQCREAVRRANEHLRAPITVPSRCDRERFLRRTKALPIAEVDRIEAFFEYYLGKPCSELGRMVQREFSADAVGEYIRDRLRYRRNGMAAFTRPTAELLQVGFDLGTIAREMPFEEGESKDGTEAREHFVRTIINMGMHTRSRGYRDGFDNDKDLDLPYDITMKHTDLFEALEGTHNSSVDRFIPLDEIRASLRDAFREQVDVDRIIDESLAHEEAAQEEVAHEEEARGKSKSSKSGARRRGVYSIPERLIEERARYDIIEYEGLTLFKRGDSLPPHMVTSLKDLRGFFEKLLEKESYTELLEDGPVECCKWFTAHNTRVLLLDTEWARILADIANNRQAFARYYPIPWAQIDNVDVLCMLRALAVNDDLYEFFLEIE